jgi:hypothetical protein
VRIRKNFLTREEAAAEKATLEIKAIQVSSVSPSDDVVDRRAASGHRGLVAPVAGPTAAAVVLRRLRAGELSPTRAPEALAEAVKIYLAEPTKAFEYDMLSMRQLRSIRNELETL